MTTFDGETAQAILTSLRARYGSLVQPNFRKVYENLRADTDATVIKVTQESGIKVRDEIDLNDDVSIRPPLDRTGDHVGLGLSGVGPFAMIVHMNAEGRYSWVTQPDDAPTPWAAVTARTALQAGFKLLDRSLVSRSIAMTWYDDPTEVTLYQALFSDSDQIPQ